MHLLKTEHLDCRDGKCLVNCVCANAGSVPNKALWSYIILRCEHYMKVYYCYSSDTHTRLTYVCYSSQAFIFYVLLFTDSLCCWFSVQEPQSVWLLLPCYCALQVLITYFSLVFSSWLLFLIYANN